MNPSSNALHLQIQGRTQTLMVVVETSMWLPDVSKTAGDSVPRGRLRAFYILKEKMTLGVPRVTVVARHRLHLGAERMNGFLSTSPSSLCQPLCSD